MAKIKRLRVFAGPNGSGKSTLFEAVAKNFNTGFFLNADNIEKTLTEKGFVDLTDYGICASQTDWNKFLGRSDAASLVRKATDCGYEIAVEIKENVIVNASGKTHSYEGALVSMFLRECLIADEVTFSFETVMSHPSKLDEISDAKKRGYKTYLYFVCTDAPEVNIARIANRVEKGGHDVAPQKVTERYFKTLENAYPAIRLCDKAYLFDNSDALTLIAEVREDGAMQLHAGKNKLPNWFHRYVLTHYDIAD